LKAATIGTPRNEPRSDRITLPVIVVATGFGTPKWPSTKRRIDGPP
jgi:hypothetical protein